MFSRIVSMPILPAQFIGSRFGKYLSNNFTKENLENSRNDLIKNLKCEEFNIQTKDKVKLNGMLFKREDSYTSKIKKIFRKIFGKNQALNRKVWINFNGNGVCYEFLDKNKIKLIQSLGFDVLAFNYRSVVKSEGEPTQKGLIEDGKTILKYANSLGYDDSYIHAHSLGGAIATKSVLSLKLEDAAVYNNIRLMVDRTFSSIKAVLKTFNIFRLIKWIAIKILKLSYWNIKVKKDWDKIDTKKCLFYSLNDEVINENCALFGKVKNSTDKTLLVELKNYGHCNELSLKDIKKALSIVS